MEKEELDVKVIHLEKHNKFLERRLKKLEGIIKKLDEENDELRKKESASPDVGADDFIRRVIGQGEEGGGSIYGRKEKDKYEKYEKEVWKQYVPNHMETEDDKSLIGLKSKGVRDV